LVPSRLEDRCRRISANLQHLVSRSHCTSVGVSNLSKSDFGFFVYYVCTQEYLSLEGLVAIQGSVPTEIGLLSNLGKSTDQILMSEWWRTCKAHRLCAVVLDFQGASLTGQLPSEIGQLSKLGEFDIRDPTFFSNFLLVIRLL
jgi:hypothetical protein